MCPPVSSTVLHTDKTDDRYDENCRAYDVDVELVKLDNDGNGGDVEVVKLESNFTAGQRVIFQILQ